MKKLNDIKVSTCCGTLMLLAASLPLVTYAIYFHGEEAKLHNGVLTSPQWTMHTETTQAEN